MEVLNAKGPHMAGLEKVVSPHPITPQLSEKGISNQRYTPNLPASLAFRFGVGKPCGQINTPLTSYTRNSRVGLAFRLEAVRAERKCYPFPHPY